MGPSVCNDHGSAFPALIRPLAALAQINRRHNLSDARRGESSASLKWPSSHRRALGNNLADRSMNERCFCPEENLPAETFLLPGTALLPGGTVLLLLGIPHC